MEQNSESPLRSHAAESSRKIAQGISPANLTTLFLVVSQVTRIWRLFGHQWWHNSRLPRTLASSMRGIEANRLA